MTSDYDLLVIGSGSAATSAAFAAKDAGLSTAVIDSRPLGGTCALRGCDPKKVLYGATDVMDSFRRMSGRGIIGKAEGIDWKELVRFKRTFTEPMPGKLEKSLREYGIDIYREFAEFAERNTIRVGENTLRGRNILVASGAKPMDLGIDGSGNLVDSERFMELQKLPERIAFIGGGYISVEFAGIAQRAGSSTTVIHRGGRLLKSFDAELVKRLQTSLMKEGVQLRLSHKVKKVEKYRGGFRIISDTPEGERSVEADLVVHGAGRVADLDRLRPEAGGVEYGPNGIRVNEYLQSVSNESVYAAGDSADTRGYKLTPVAMLEGSAAAHNIINGNSVKPEYQAVPTVVFSLPPLSKVGVTEKEAETAGLDYTVRSGDSSGWYNSRRKGLMNTGYKVIIDKRTSEILGAHILGDNSEEVINTFSLAMRHHITSQELKTYPFAYPSDTTELRYML